MIVIIFSSMFNKCCTKIYAKTSQIKLSKHYLEGTEIKAKSLPNKAIPQAKRIKKSWHNEKSTKGCTFSSSIWCKSSVLSDTHVLK